MKTPGDPTYWDLAPPIPRQFQRVQPGQDQKLPPTSFDFVFRFSAPAGYKGRACRVIKQPWGALDGKGNRIPNCGAETVTVEFEGGEQLRCVRSAIVRRQARQAQAAVEIRQHGGLNRKQRRQRDERAAREAR
jgi:hypothetical protein